jgi:hypothetical protein
MPITTTALALLSLTQVAAAAPGVPPIAPTPTPAAAAAAQTHPVADYALLSDQDVLDMNDRLAGVGVGFDMGLWGDRYANGLTVSIPFGKGDLGQHFGVRLRGVLVHDDTGDQFTPVAAGGAELFGRGPVLLGVLRVYGGGGLYYGGIVNSPSVDSTPELIGGGHFGVEFAVTKRQTFSFEVGGQGPISPEEFDAGASVMAGWTIYLGKPGRRG